MTEDPMFAEPAEAPPPAPASAAAKPRKPAAEGDAALLALIDRFAAILDKSDLSELEIEIGGTGLTLRKPEAVAPQVVVAAGAAAAPGSPGAAPAATEAASAPPAGRPSVKAPLTGIWYGSPSPGSTPFVEVGGDVAVGQVIGLIEAMKLFNEIKSDLAGRVVRVIAEPGKLVKAKQPLIEVVPL
ncbi:MAG TPA: biotin/lipoyl-containing protein [Candidatus Polarisedimenticolia bacterium]|nr:biotin/lipoyl-containing protein [Candidatus Polarisedimenticolia bacterium]